MKTPALILALVLLNLILLVGLIVPGRVGAAPADAPVLRAQILELVDAKGAVRMNIRTEPDGQVVFRLMDADGTIRVKLGADKTGGGLTLLNGATELGAQLLANPDAKLTLRNSDGGQRVITPVSADPSAPSAGRP